MARPTWNGHISFGLVNIPVVLFTGEKKADLSFNLIDSRNMARVRYERVNDETGEEVPWATSSKASSSQAATTFSSTTRTSNAPPRKPPRPSTSKPSSTGKPSTRSTSRSLITWYRTRKGRKAMSCCARPWRRRARLASPGWSSALAGTWPPCWWKGMPWCSTCCASTRSCATRASSTYPMVS
jgi:hypothetical protein